MTLRFNTNSITPGSSGSGGDGVLPTSVYTRSPVYTSSTKAEIDISDIVDASRYYCPIVITHTTTPDLTNHDVARKTLSSVCEYNYTAKKIELTYTDNSFQQTNQVDYTFILLPIKESTSTYVKGITDGLDGLISNMQTINNLVTSVSALSTDTQYPSAKCVYDALQANLPQPVLLSSIAVTTGATESSTISIDLTTTYSVPYSDDVAYVPILNYSSELCQLVEKIYTGKANQKDLLVLKAGTGYKFPASSYFTMQCTLIPVKASSTAGTYYYGASAGMTGRLVTSISNTSSDNQFPSAKCVYDLVGDIETLLQNV